MQVNTEVYHQMKVSCHNSILMTVNNADKLWSICAYYKYNVKLHMSIYLYILKYK